MSDAAEKNNSLRRSKRRSILLSFLVPVKAADQIRATAARIAAVLVTLVLAAEHARAGASGLSGRVRRLRPHGFRWPGVPALMPLAASLLLAAVGAWLACAIVFAAVVGMCFLGGGGNGQH
ncbi:MAG: hypothetical protein HKL99_14230 [Burkholderiales bacterium]|nr:hypothetical protein [Burkholderiales bacterium]